MIVESSGERLAWDYDKIRIGRVIAAGREDGSISPEILSAIAAKPRAITIEVKPAGKARNLTGFQQSVSGSMVQFLLVVMLASGGVSFLADRRQGILRRLAASPIVSQCHHRRQGAARLCRRQMRMGSSALLVQDSAENMGQEKCFSLWRQWRLPRAIHKPSCPNRNP